MMHQLLPKYYQVLLLKMMKNLFPPVLLLQVKQCFRYYNKSLVLNRNNIVIDMFCASHQTASVNTTWRKNAWCDIPIYGCVPFSHHFFVTKTTHQTFSVCGREKLQHITSSLPGHVSYNCGKQRDILCCNGKYLWKTKDPQKIWSQRINSWPTG